MGEVLLGANALPVFFIGRGGWLTLRVYIYMYVCVFTYNLCFKNQIVRITVT